MKCAYDKCENVNEFTPKTHNQKYCSDECCRIATNEKLKQAYYEKKDRLAGKKRICKVRGCQVNLDRYNPGSICSKCVQAEKEKERLSLIDMLKKHVVS